MHCSRCIFSSFTCSPRTKTMTYNSWLVSHQISSEKNVLLLVSIPSFHHPKSQPQFSINHIVCRSYILQLNSISFFSSLLFFYHHHKSPLKLMHHHGTTHLHRNNWRNYIQSCTTKTTLQLNSIRSILFSSPPALDSHINSLLFLLWWWRSISFVCSLSGNPFSDSHNRKPRVEKGINFISRVDCRFNSSSFFSCWATISGATWHGGDKRAIGTFPFDGDCSWIT